MRNRSQLALVLTSLIGWTLGNGLLPLLPLYASRQGIEPGEIGLYMAISYFALLLGTATAAFTSGRFGRYRVQLWITGAATIAALIGMSAARGFWPLVAATSATWFVGGHRIAMLSVIAGLTVKAEERGSFFGWLALTGAAGALIGGLCFGYVAERWSFSTLFLGLAGLSALLPVIDTFIEAPPPPAKEARGRAPGGRLTSAFLLFMLAVVTAAGARLMGRFGVSLRMEGLHFDAAAVSLTGAIGGAIALPLPAILGRLSDRLGRRPLLGLCYASGVAGLLVLARAETFTEFCVVTGLLAILGYASMGVSSALVTDLLEKEALNRGLSIFNGLSLAGGILGFGLSGYLMEKLGDRPAFLAAAGAIVAAGLLLLLVRPPPKEADAVG